MTLSTQDAEGEQVEVFAVEPTATVTARLLDKSLASVLIGEVTCDDGHALADWPNGVVAVQFPSAATEGLATGFAVLHVSVDDSTRTSFTARVAVQGMP